MKKFIYLFALLFLGYHYSYSQIIEEKKTIDYRLVGVWKGEEKDNQEEGMSKSWMMTRKNDGTFILKFKFTINGKTKNTEEKGKWWIEGNKFFEYHETSDLTDVYSYIIISNDKVKFKAENLSLEHNNENYEFIDERVK